MRLRTYRSRNSESLLIECRSSSIVEGRPSRCTSPDRPVVRMTAWMGRGTLASSSVTVKVASEPSDTTNVMPS